MLAIRKSGPCDFEKLVMWNTRSGNCDARLTSGEDEIMPEWSSSTTQTSERSMISANSFARPGVIDTPVGFCARGWITIPTGRSRAPSPR